MSATLGPHCENRHEDHSNEGPIPEAMTAARPGSGSTTGRSHSLRECSLTPDGYSGCSHPLIEATCQ